MTSQFQFKTRPLPSKFKFGIDIIKRKSFRWVVHKGRISSPWQPLSTGWNGVIVSQTK